MRRTSRSDNADTGASVAGPPAASAAGLRHSENAPKVPIRRVPETSRRDGLEGKRRLTRAATTVVLDGGDLGAAPCGSRRRGRALGRARSAGAAGRRPPVAARRRSRRHRRGADPLRRRRRRPVPRPPGRGPLRRPARPAAHARRDADPRAGDRRHRSGAAVVGSGHAPRLDRQRLGAGPDGVRRRAVHPAPQRIAAAARRLERVRRRRAARRRAGPAVRLHRRRPGLGSVRRHAGARRRRRHRARRGAAVRAARRRAPRRAHRRLAPDPVHGDDYARRPVVRAVAVAVDGALAQRPADGAPRRRRDRRRRPVAPSTATRRC